MASHGRGGAARGRSSGFSFNTTTPEALPATVSFQEAYGDREASGCAPTEYLLSHGCKAGGAPEAQFADVSHWLLLFFLSLELYVSNLYAITDGEGR